ncbi:MAG: glycosyltransferase family 4 protein [Ignavibacteriales bacterium]|nr:MAG: glycosyltransferase family 4 protein [Ignavibacteriales bacterium]
MNILFISPDFNYACGVSKHVYILIKRLCNNPQYKIFFITNSGDSLDRLTAINNLKFSRMNFKKDHSNPFLLIKNLVSLFLFCRRNKIELIHTHHRYPELISVLAAKLLRIKTITTVHSFVAGMNNISFRSDKIIAVSRSIEDHLIKNFPHSRNKIVTLYNCIDESFYSDVEYHPDDLRRSLKYDSSDKIILFAGRISRIKGSDVLIKAFNKIDKSLNAKLILIGTITDNDLDVELRNNESIKILSPQRDLRHYFKIADVVVLPSIEDPFPYVMIEAGAMKKVFIGSRTGGIGEFIDDNVNGILVTPGSSDDLSSKLENVLKNLPSISKMGEELFQKVKSSCDCEKYFSELSGIYNTLIKEG